MNLLAVTFLRFDSLPASEVFFGLLVVLAFEVFIIPNFILL
jgi:hypothetical protein